MKLLDARVFKTYRLMVEQAYPAEVDNWPILSGYNLKFGKYHAWSILVFEHTGNPIPLKIPLEHLTAAVVGVDDIGSDTELARQKLTRHLHLSRKDMLVLLNSRASNLGQELDIAFKQHETLVKKQAGLDPGKEIPKPPLLSEKAEAVKADEPAKVPDKPAPGPAEVLEIPAEGPVAGLKELPQNENSQAVEVQGPKTVVVIQKEVKPEIQPQKNKVLIIHGNNEKIKKSLRNFLLSLGLQAVEWAEALLMAEKPDPDHSDVIRVAFEQCQAAIIVLTNDKQDMVMPEEGSGLRALPQTELNALFLAGMATAIGCHKTVAAGLGNPEPFHSIPGLYITALDNTLEKRKKFIERLKAAGCEIKAKGKAWQISGDFDIDLKPVFADKQPPPQPVDIEPAKETLSSQIQPEKVTRETMEKLEKDHSPEKLPAAASLDTAPDSREQPPRGKSLMDSLSIMNILKTKKRPKKEKPAPEPVTPPQPAEKAETIPEVLKTPAPVVKKPPQKKQEPVPAAKQPDPVPPPKKDKRPVVQPKTEFESKEPQKQIKEPAPKKADGLNPDEKEFLNRIRELEGKLEALKNRGGRINQRAVDDLEKQIQNEKNRLRTIRQLANIENIKKSYEVNNNKVKREDK